MTFTYQTLDDGQSTIVSIDGNDISPAIVLGSDTNVSYVHVNLTTPGYHWIILKNVDNAFGVYLPVTNGFFSTPPVAYITLAIMGDSFIDAHPTNMFPDYLAEFVPGLNVCKFGEGGTGWEATQNPSFGYTNFWGRINDMQKVNPSYVIFAGGINDHDLASADTNAYYQLVYNTALAAKAAYPNAKFAVVSPFWPRTPVDADVTLTGMIISNACVNAGLINSNAFFNILLSSSHHRQQLILILEPPINILPPIQRILPPKVPPTLPIGWPEKWQRFGLNYSTPLRPTNRSNFLKTPFFHWHYFHSF